MTGRGEPERLAAVSATANLLPMLGVASRLGRTFTAEEDRPAGARVVMLSYGFWQRRFGGDPAIIGQRLTLDGESRQVIGVLPPGFQFYRPVEVWLPLALDVPQELKRERMSIVTVMGRLRPGISVAQARAELNLILQRIEKANANQPPGLQSRMILLSEKLVGNFRRGLLALFGAVGFVLLIACANVANLLLGRATLRRKELAVRAALGAGRGRLLRLMLTESLLLSVLGGAAGLLLAVLGVKALVAFSPDDLARVNESSVDRAVLGFTCLTVLLTCLVTGLIPALQISQLKLNEILKDGARRSAPEPPTSCGW
ncbi:MAG: ABC transporter permease [Blastocatellia bacterium]